MATLGSPETGGISAELGRKDKALVWDLQRNTACVHPLEAFRSTALADQVLEGYSFGATKTNKPAFLVLLPSCAFHL